MPRNGRTSGSEGGTPSIQAVERAATILGAFTVARPKLTLNELTARLGTSKPTAHRYTKALRSANLVRYDDREGVYTLGPQVLTLAAAARAGLPIIDSAGPIMESLVREVNETVVLSVWDGDAPVVVRVDDNTDRTIRISVRTGVRLALFTSAQGRVFCAHLGVEDVPRLPAALRKEPDLAAELTLIRETGISVNSPVENGVRTIASPVLQDGRIVAAIAIVGTTASISDRSSAGTSKALLRASHELSASIGSDRLS